MLPIHPTHNLTCYDLVRDAGFVARERAAEEGTPYAIAYVPYGFAAVRVSELHHYDLHGQAIIATVGGGSAKRRVA